MTAIVLRILSGGAVQRGLESAAEIFQRETGHRIAISFATAPVLRRKVENKEESPDIVVAPVPLMMDFEGEGCIVAGSSIAVGSVKAGVVVRQGPWSPDISSVESLKRELVASDSIVYNQGSSGIFVEKLIQNLGLADLAKAKTTRLPDAESVMIHLAESGAVREIGFGQITAIVLHAGRGVKLVGPLPKEVENVTTYAAGVSTSAEFPAQAKQLVSFLTAPAAKEAFKAAGVAPSD